MFCLVSMKNHSKPGFCEKVTAWEKWVWVCCVWVAMFGFWEKRRGLGLLCMGCLAKRGGSTGKEWWNEGHLRLNEGMVIRWVCCDSLSGETKWWFSEFVVFVYRFPVFVFGFVVVDFSQGFGFVVVEWVVLYCLVFGKNTEHELQ